MKSPLCRLVICRRALKKWSEARDFTLWAAFREEYIYTFAGVMWQSIALFVFAFRERTLDWL